MEIRLGPIKLSVIKQIDDTSWQNVETRNAELFKSLS